LTNDEAATGSDAEALAGIPWPGLRVSSQWTSAETRQLAPLGRTRDEAGAACAHFVRRWGQRPSEKDTRV